jgi:signal transduction histidine kinase
MLLSEPLPFLVCDKVRITEVFRNLVTNALKYNSSNERIIEIGFLKERSTEDGLLYEDVIYVKDNGVGIAPEFKDEVFRIFRRLNNTKNQEEGTGVGLTFVKKIIERHGGTIWLESETGKGTTFYFTLEGTEYGSKSV